MNLGATPRDGFTEFLVWAPLAQRVELALLAPERRVVPMDRDGEGYWSASVEAIGPGAVYAYRLDGRELPDPASRHQPEGVRGPSQVVDRSFDVDRWRGLPFRDAVFYELHVGTFTAGGTFDGVVEHLPYLKDLGVTALELMPVAQFPGARNWGYDGVFPFAVQNTYGGPEGLRRLVRAAHGQGLAVFMDVVYNHLGPEGAVLREFGPYFNGSYRTAWGSAFNFDGPWSDEVRRYFVENALMWLGEYGLDGLRLDAVHAIMDLSSRPFMLELASEVHRAAEHQGRPFYLVAENDRNDMRYVRPPWEGGFDLDATWADDVHHALQALLVGERSPYRDDYGGASHVARGFEGGIVYTGQRSRFRRRRHGSSSRGIARERFVTFLDNHDQAGNAQAGERIGHLAALEPLKAATAAVLLGPGTPLLFMGQEYADPSPFLYFVSHEDPRLVEAVRRGRREEFAEFGWTGEPPDPQDPATFERCRLRLDVRGSGRHGTVLALTKELLRLRRTMPDAGVVGDGGVQVQSREQAGSRLLLVHRRDERREACLLLNLSAAVGEAPLPLGSWERRLDTADVRWAGPGAPSPVRTETPGPPATLSPWSAVLYERREG